MQPRDLAILACYNPRDPRCAACTALELTLGTCTALAESEVDRNIGFLTAWGMFVCFLIPLAAVVLRRTTWLWTGLTCIVAIVIGTMLQTAIPSPRPAGACMENEYNCGMPSGHCTTAYAAFFFILFYLVRDVKRNGIKKRLTPLGLLWGAVLFVFMLTQLLMAYGRLAIYYHTVDQVGWGFFAGFMIGTFCYVIVLYLLGPCLGPFMERKLKCIGFRDDWNYVNGKTPQEPEKQQEQQQLAAKVEDA